MRCVELKSSEDLRPRAPGPGFGTRGPTSGSSRSRTSDLGPETSDLLLHHHAAVDDEYLTRDMAALVRRQECHERRDVGRLPETFERDLCEQHLFCLVGH